MTTKEILGTVRDKAQQGIDLLPLRRRQPTRQIAVRRASKIGGTTASLGAVVYGAFWVWKNRYASGTSSVATTTVLDDGRLVVALNNGTTLVVSAQDTGDMKNIATPGKHVAYQVNRLSFGGVPAGRISSRGLAS